jgi:CHAD domain-containing protein
MSGVKGRGAQAHEAGAEQNTREFLEQSLLRAADEFDRARESFQRRPQEKTVHDLRIAARKLRSVIALVGKLAPSDHLNRLAQHARAVAGALADAREADVLQKAFAVQSADTGQDAGAAALAAMLEQQKATSYRNAIAAIGSSGSLHLAFMTRRANGRPQKQLRALDTLGLRLSRTPASETAGNVLDRLVRRVRRRARGIKKFDEHQRHRLRLAVKNLRYATEFFAPLFPGDQRIPAYLALVVKLQNDLGICNDAAVARRRLRRTKGTVKAFLAVQEKEARKAMRHLGRRTRRLAHAQAFWR